MISMLGNKHVLIIIIILVFSFIGAQSTSQFYHKNPNQVYAGDEILLSVTMFAADPIISGMLFFRSKNQISYQEIPMNHSGGNWEASIPGRNRFSCCYNRGNKYSSCNAYIYFFPK